jgi:gliding motility-associated-like protein
MKLSIKILFLTFILTNSAFAQNEATFWYFGEYAGLKFTDTGVVALTDGKLNTVGGNATISDKNGYLLFYTDGVSVFNKNHDTMVNGKGLMGHYYTHQSALIIPFPSAPYLYYIFTMENHFTNNGLRYSIVDMSKNNGFGEVIEKNIPLLSGCTSKMNAIMHANNNAIWLITRDYNSKDFITFLISKRGIDTNYTRYQGNLYLDYWYDKSGYLKVSPDARKIVHCATTKRAFEICNFNNVNGEISNCLTIDIPLLFTPMFRRPLSCEFSPSGRFLYLSSEGDKFIMQFDMSKQTSSDIENSIKIIGYNSQYPLNVLPYSLQLGIDGKIYVSNYNSDYIGVILYPENEDTLCTYIENYIYLKGGKAKNGLPVFIQSYFFIPEFNSVNLCYGDSTSFKLSDSSHVDSLLWCFGDSSTGNNNFSHLFEPKHVFYDTGVFNVSVVFWHDYGTPDTFTREIKISPYPSPSFQINTIEQCYLSNLYEFSNTTSISIGSCSYEWDFGDTVKSYDTNGVHSYYWSDSFNVKLYALSDYGCLDSITKSVIVYPPHADFEVFDSNSCYQNNLYKFVNTSVNEFGAINFKLYFGDGDSVDFPDSVLHNYQTTDTFQAILIASSGYGCADTAIREVIVKPSPISSFYFNDSIQCFDQHNMAVYNNTSILYDSIAIEKWIVNDTDTFNNHSLSSMKFSSADTFSVKLIAESYLGCYDTIVKSFIVHKSPTATILINDTSQCFNQNSFTFLNPWSFGNPKGLKEWHFGDGQTSSSDTANHSYASADTFQIILIEETNQGCRDTATKKVIVHPSPKANFSFNDSVQCFNEQMLVADNLSLVARDSIVESKWIVNSDTVLSKDIVNYTFNKYGSYPIKLIVTTKNNCRDTSTSYFILHPSPIAKFTLDDSAHCFNTQSLVARSSSLVASDTITETKWILNSDTILAIEITNYQFTQPGTYPIQLIVTTSNHCFDTLTKTFALFPNPLADFSVNDSAQCFNEQNFQVTNHSTIQSGTMSFQWYVDNQPYSTMQQFSNLAMQQSGKFPITLTVTSSQNCSDSTTKEIIIHPSPKADFKHEQPCLDIPNQFTDQSTIEAPGIIDQWYWDFGDGNSETNQNPKNTYTSSGTYQVFFTATSDQGCPDTIIKNLQFYEHPGIIELERATVVEDKYIQIDWKPNTQGNPQKIVLEKSMDNIRYSFIDSFEMSEKTYNDHKVEVDDYEYWYRLFSVDHCKHQSDYSNIGKAVLLSIDTLNQENSISWTEYSEWQNGVSGYTLEIFNEDKQTYEEVTFNSQPMLDYIDSITILDQPQYCYKITARRDDGLESHSNVICVSSPPIFIFAPNAFTPNKDELNNTFKPVGENILSFNMQIYDRWGTKLFETNNINKGWDGTYKNQPCPMDAYYFFITATGTGDQVKNLKGTVVLVR